MPSFGAIRCQESGLNIVGIPSTGFFAKKLIKILESQLDFVNVRSSIIIKYYVKIGKRCCRFFLRYSQIPECRGRLREKV